jgi:hypothetical protein
VVTDDELKAGLAAIDGWFARDVPFALIIDARGGWPFSSEQRGWVIDHMRNTRAQSERLLIQALIIDNPLVRALYYAVSWAVPMAFPSKVFADDAPAREWVDVQLKDKERHRREST